MMRGFMWYRLVVGVAFLVLAGGCRWGGKRGGRVAPQRVVLFAVDGLRADRLSANGYEFETPQLDALAAQGVYFPYVVAPASWGAPSLASVLTGASPRGHLLRHGLLRADGTVSGQQVLNPELPTLAERFAAAGYRTALVTASPYVSAEKGFARGFDSFTVLTNSAPQAVSDAALAVLDEVGAGELFMVIHYSSLELPRRVPGGVAVRESEGGVVALAAVDNMNGELLQNHFNELIRHRGDSNLAARVNSEIRGLREALSAIYDASVNVLSEEMARVWQGVPTEGTLLALFGTCGEGLLEHGLIGNGVALFPEMTVVPLMLRDEYSFSGGLKIHGPLSLLDLPMTVAAAMGWEGLVDEGGVELVPVVKARHVPQRRLIFMETERPLAGSWRGIVAWPWKLTLNLGEGRVGVWLSHLSFDPNETTNLATRQPEVAQELESAARQWWGM